MSREDQVSAFRAFAFESDEGYQKYMRSVELPGGNAELALLKVKAKWWKREKNSAFDPEWVLGGTGKATTPPAPRPQPPLSSSTGTYNGGGRSTHHSTYTTPPPQQQQHAAGTTQQQQYLLLANVLFFVLAFIYFIPLLGGGWSYRAYRCFLILLASFSAYRLILRYGRPRINWQSFQLWAANAFTSNEAHFTLLGLSFMAQPPISLLLLPPLISASFELVEYGSKHFAAHPLWVKYAAPNVAQLRAKRSEALVMSAGVEVLIGFTLILKLISPARSIMLLFLYWNMLKSRYVSRDAGVFHHKVWSQVHMRAAPLLARVPLLQQVVGYAQRWFISGTQR